MYRSAYLFSAMSETNMFSIRTLGTFWTGANLLSLLRIALVAPIAYLILKDGPISWILGLIFLAITTDWFDGTLARWSGTVSEWGKVLDPLADKIAASAVVLALVLTGSLPVWFLILVLGRDLLIVLGSVIAAHRLNRVLMSIWMGKVAVFSLSLTVLAALLKADPPVMQVSVWGTSVLFMYSFLLYAVRYFNLVRTRPGPDDRELPFSIKAVEPRAESVH